MSNNNKQVDCSFLTSGIPSIQSSRIRNVMLYSRQTNIVICPPSQQNFNLERVHGAKLVSVDNKLSFRSI